MTSLNLFTSYDSIRAVLGVSEDDLEDVTLELPIYLQLLRLDFGTISSDIESLYLPLVADPPPPLTPIQQRFVDLVQLFSAYATAKTLLTSLPLFAPKSITDGRAKLDRFADPLEMVKDGVESLYNTIKDRLAEVLEEMGEDVPVASARVFFATAPLGYNPVTNI